MPRDTMEMPDCVIRAIGEITRAAPPGAGEDDTREIEMSFSSEAPYERYFGIEILGHDPGEIDLEWIGSGRAPALVDHKRGVDNQIGVVVRVWVEDGVARAVVRFGKGARASEMLERVRDGELVSTSVGYRVGEMKLIEEHADEPDIYRVTDWRPLEVSLVSIPADPTVGVGRGEGEGGTHPVNIIKGRGNMPPINSQTETRENPTPGTVAVASAPVAPAVPVITEEERAAAREAAAEAESSRCGEIASIAARFNISRDDAAKAMKKGWSPAEFRGFVLEQMGDGAQERLTNSAMVGLNEREVRQFSLVRLLHALANPNDPGAQKQAGHEFEVCRAAEGATERAVQGQLIPIDILRRADFVAGQRDLTVGTATAGGHLVSTDLLSGSFIDLLRNKSSMFALGATRLMDLVGDIAIPRQTGGASAAWIAEAGDAAESDAAFDQVTLSPKTIAAYTDVSRRLLKQSSVDIEGLVRRDLATAMALAIDAGGLYGTGASNQPEGINAMTGINTTVFAAASPTFAEVVAMETAVAVDNADVGALAYCFDPAFRGHFKTTEKFSGTGQTIWEPGGTVNGYANVVSKQVTTGDMFFGNWADALIAMWGGLDVLVDPYAQSLKGGVRVIVHQDADVAGRHPESFCVSRDAP